MRNAAGVDGAMGEPRIIPGEDGYRTMLGALDTVLKVLGEDAVGDIRPNISSRPNTAGRAIWEVEGPENSGSPSTCKI